MATVIEDNCVSCAMYCINCGRRHEEVIKCDARGCDEYAKYKIDDDDYCEEHAKEYLMDMFSDLDILEMAELLQIKITTV